MRRIARRPAGPVLLLGVGLLGGCAAETAGAAGQDALTAGDPGASRGDAQADGAVPEWPSGGVPDLTFQSGDGAPWSFSALRADPSRSVLLLVTAAGWCTACFEEQPFLQRLHEEHAARGLQVAVAVFEDSQFAPADPADAVAWSQRFGLSFPVLADPDFAFAAINDDRSVTPVTAIIDLRTATMLYTAAGARDSVVEQVVRSALP